LVAEDDGFCVDRAFKRFWLATRHRQPHHFEDLASIFKYLKMCLASVLLDEARGRRRQAWVSIDDVSPETCVSADSSAHVLERVALRELWDVVEFELLNDNERLVARLSLISGLSPREIVARHPERFLDVYSVYRTKRNLLDRLQRNARLNELRS
jgi:hypothetical protein